MNDTLTNAQRSWNMGRIGSKNTTPELILRSLLHKYGFRFRLHQNKLPGKPDIILPKYNTIIFVHGCYWHRHQACKKATTPKTNAKFWINKFKENIKRDKLKQDQLERAGWKVIISWECEINSMKKNEAVFQSIIHNLIF